MTSRIELNWKLDGFVDEQRYYCSETPIDSENLPVAKVVLAGDVRTHVDSDIEVGKTYFVRIGSVKNGIEKISDEIKISASALVSYQYLRIYITANNGNGITSLQEIEIAEATGGLDITVPVMQTSQSSYFTGAEANNAARLIDNNFTNYFDKVWVTVDGNVFPQWAWVNLGAVRNFAELRLYPQNYSGGATRAPKDFIIQGSNDGLEWVAIKSFSNVTGWVAGTAKIINLMTGVVT
ncbi:MAG: discoidin domain-containing protein [Acinetobacter sp.]